MERVNQYFKDGTESFDDYYSCMQNDYNLFHVYNWIQFFVSMYNDTTSKKNYFINELNDRGEYILAYEPEIIDEEKKIDFLVNNADYGLLGALEDISIEEAKK